MATGALRRRLHDQPLVRRGLRWWRGEDLSLARRADLSAVPIAVPEVYVGTHHKSGTVWLTGVFRRIAERTDARYRNLFWGHDVARGRARTVIVDPHSRFEGVDLSQGRGIRMVRDPRDLLVSAVHYHRRAEEPWLLRPRADGRSYRETMRALDDEAAALFELDNVTGRVIGEMLAFDGGETVRTVRYEDLVGDADLTLWHPLLHWLGFRSADLLIADQCVWEGSLFGLGGRGGHVRSGRPGEWRDALTERVLARLDARFPDALARLGYA